MSTEKIIKALIVDDEERSRRAIASIINNYATNTEIVGEAESVNTAIKLIGDKNPNVILLDINMPYKNGFDLLKELPDRKYHVIFITAYEGYALRAIKFHAFNYILKPVNIDELVNTLDDLEKIVGKENEYDHLQKLIEDLNNPKSDKHKLAIPAKEGREYVEIGEIVRFKADGSATWIYLTDGRKVLSSKNLGEYQKILPQEDEGTLHFFMRIHHGDIINFSQINKLHSKESKFEMKDGTLLNIAQRRRSDVMKLLKNRKLI